MSTTLYVYVTPSGEWCGQAFRNREPIFGLGDGESRTDVIEAAKDTLPPGAELNVIDDWPPQTPALYGSRDR